MLNELMKRAAQDEPVYLPDIRRDFEACGTRRFVIRVRMYFGAEREYDLRLPETSDEAEEDFVKEYIYAVVYNILSALGALEAFVLTDADDLKTRALAESLNDVFQTSLPREQRRGYGKCLNVNERVIHMITGEWRKFSFEVRDLEEPDADSAADTAHEAENRNSAGIAPGQGNPSANGAVFPGDKDIAEKSLLGIDIGGTDIKMTASVGGMLMFCKEYDWNPEAFRTAEE
ncbi:MAG: hypothetical protein K6C06_05425, partial [Lachnospiraceae bacterium]|nr:hypothetical protein [Lachnospiraceae bacterium]